MTGIRRARGKLLRVANSRRAAALSGVVLLAPVLVVALGDHHWESWVTDGLGLVLGSTGVALLLIAVGGRRPDWIDPDGPRDR